MSSEAPAKDPTPLTRIQIRYARLMGSLEMTYQHLRPEFAKDGFRQRVYKRLSNRLRSDPAQLLNPDGQLDRDRFDAFIKEIELAALPARMDIWNIHAGCAYCVLAEMAYEKREADQAWDFLVEAAMYHGWILSVMRGPDVYDHEVLKAVKSESGRKASDGRHRRNREMKEAAYAHVRENGGFPSQGRAVVSIEGMLREKFPVETPLKDPKTIPRWLKNMPGREELFDTLKKRKK